MDPLAPKVQDSRSNACGIDCSLVAPFLEIIRDKYAAAEAAIFFLEERAGIVSTSAIANLRDVMSHLSTMLNPDTEQSKRERQLASAEEHLRRAIMDPYAIAIGRLRKEFGPILREYRRRVLPLKYKLKRSSGAPDETELQARLSGAPDETELQARLDEIAALTECGRAAKGRNLWDAQWEEGVASFIKAYDSLSRLSSQLSDLCNRRRQIGRDRWQSLFNVIAVAGTVGTILFGILSVWLVLDPSLAHRLQAVLGLASP